MLGRVSYWQDYRRQNLENTVAYQPNHDGRARQLDNSVKQQDVQLMDFIKEYLVSPGEWDQLQSLMPEEPVLPGRWEGSRHINNIPNPKFQERQELNALILERMLEA